LLIPLALLGLAGIGSVAGYAAATRDGGGGGGEGAEIVEPVPEEDYRWGYYGGQVTPQVMSTGDVEASVKLEATKNRLRELGYDVDGPNAADEIRRFQYSAGVQQDGVIGEQTAAAARSVQRQLGRHNYDIWEDEPLPGPANEPPAEY
jgi:hypothetical protein